MRKWVPLVLALALVPALSTSVAAQSTGPGEDRSARRADTRITAAQASSTALARAAKDLQANAVEPWKGKSASGLKVVSASQSNLGGRAAYIVAVMMMKSTGIVRVIVDARSGDIVDHQVGASWDWGNAPAWFKAGQNSPPETTH